MATLFNTKIKDTYQSLLKLEDNTILTTTVKNVTDGLGNASPLYMSTNLVRIGSTSGSAMYWDNVNNRLGIGTNTPTAQVTINSTDFVIGANAGYSTYYGSSINGTIQATTSGSTTQLWFRSNGNALNENDNYWSRIEQVQGGAMRILSSRYTSLVLGNNGYNNAITLYNSAAMQMPKVGINNSTPTALLQVTGVGSTSATTSLLVQNSGGTTSLQVTDDRTTFVNGLLNVGTIYSGIECTNVYSAIFQNGGSGGQIRLSMGGTNYLQINQPKDANSGVISGTINTITTPISYGYSLGTASPNLLSLNPSINNTGTYSGTFRGIYYNPTLTSLTGTTHIALETVTGNVLLGTTSGFVGIGTSNPTNKLEVVGATRISSTLNVGGDGSTGSSYSSGFIAYDTGNGYAHSLIHAQAAQLFLFANPQGFAIAGYEPASSGLSASNLAFMTSSSTRMKILSNGNVLIGTTTDAGYKLDVNGSARFSGGITLANGGMFLGDIAGSRVFNTAGLAIDYGTLYPFSITGSGTASITPAGILTLKGITHNYTATETYKVQKTTNIGHLQINFDIVGTDAVTGYNYGTKSGNVRIYPGEQSFGNGYGNVIIGHNGTSAIGNVGIGTSSPQYLLSNTSSSAPTGYQGIHTAGTNSLYWKIAQGDKYTAVFENTNGYGDGVLIKTTTSHSSLLVLDSGNTLLDVSADQGGIYSTKITSGSRIAWSSGYIEHAGGVGTNIYGNYATPYITLKEYTGNVLIGTTTDAGYKLDVNGTTRVSGGIFQSMGTQSLNLLTAGTTAQTSDRGIFIGTGTFNNTSVVGVALGNAINLGTGTGNVAIGYTANASGGSIAISSAGLSANASGGGLAIGGNSSSTGGVAIGGTTNSSGAVGIRGSATSTNAVAVGNQTVASGTFSTVIGDRASALHTQSIAIGLGSKTSANGDFVAGGYFPSGGYGIYNVYFGTGPQGDQVNEINGDSYAINGSGGFGTNKNGGNLTLAGGKGTGTGTPGNLIFATATATTTGSTLQSLTERMRINGSGNVMINTTTDNGYKFNVNGTAFVSELITTGGMVKHNPYTVGVRALEIYSGIGHGGNTGVWASMYSTGVYGNGFDNYIGTQGYGVIGDPTNNAAAGYVNNIGVYGGTTLSNATGVYGTSGLFGKVTTFRNASAALEVNSTTHGFLPPRMTAAQRSALTTITGFGTITGGSGYVDGTYYNIVLTGGGGQNAYARITVSGGTVTSVILEPWIGGLSGGFGYTNGASVSASNTQLGGSGAGFSVIINASTPVGMMVYQTDATEGLYIYKSTGWTFIA